MKLIVGISGASGVVLGYRLLEELKRHDDIETHVVISCGAERNFDLETNIGPQQVYEAADFAYKNDDLGALIASGSFETSGMIVVPCSMKTLSGIANGYEDNLLIRAVDVCLKENRRVVLVPREMPLSTAHLRNMLLAKENGCSILPAMLTFYNQADTLEQQIDHIVGKVLMQFGIVTSSFCAWKAGGSYKTGGSYADK